METYKNLNGDSGITHFKIGKDYIEVKFKESVTVYVYHSSKVGKHHIDTMKKLAVSGKGLSAYISQHPEVKNNYSIG